VNLFFFVGPRLPDPQGLLRGTGSTVRSVRIAESTNVDQRVTDLLDAAVGMWPWPWPFDSQQPTATIIVSVSDKKRPRR
jgi:hypothetical protein